MEFHVHNMMGVLVRDLDHADHIVRYSDVISATRKAQKTARTDRDIVSCSLMAWRQVETVVALWLRSLVQLCQKGTPA